MRKMVNVIIRRSMAIFLLAMVGTAAGEIIFFDDFAGDNTKGRFVMEAENYSSRLSGFSADWWEVDGNDNTFIEGPSATQTAPTTRSGARGNYMEALGRQIGSIAPIEDSYNGPLLTYKVSIDTPGTYRLYVRWTARDIYSDSLYAFILRPDGTLLTGAGPDYFMYHQCRSHWIWDNRGVQNTTKCAFAGFPAVAVWKISEPGEYTICIALRENATALDALVFQTANNLPLFTDEEPRESVILFQNNLPVPTGPGPPQSLFAPEEVKLSTAEIIALNQIRHMIAEKVEVLEKTQAALEKDVALYKTLNEMLENGKYGTLSYSSLSAARDEIYSVIQQEKQLKETLERSIGKLEDTLRTLGFEPEPILGGQK